MRQPWKVSFYKASIENRNEIANEILLKEDPLFLLTHEKGQI